MASQLIVSLEAREGKNPGEAIGTYQRCHIVFLPHGTPVDVTVRVVLEEITTKKDSAGRTMYRGVPAPVEYSDRWKNNGDGTISKITVSKDWLGTDCEEGIIETRQLATREGAPYTRTERQVRWGSTLAACTVDVADITTIPTEVEMVQNGQLGWRKTSEREEKSSCSVSVTDVRVTSLDSTVWQSSYPSEWQLSAAVDHDGTSISVRVPWSNAPKEVRERIENRYPVCVCGRQRYDVQNSDGYLKCEKCREEEHCVRCGKQAKVAVISSRLICANCKPYEEQEQLVNRVCSVQQRQALAQQATRLLAGNAVPREAGEAIMRSTLGHVEPEWKRNDLAQKHAGYAWYYFCDEGVYGSKFPSAALQILQGLSEASGNGVVELVAWLTGYQKVDDCERYGDFFCRTQVRGETVTPTLTESSLQRLILTVKLRGSEADRIEVLQKYRAMTERPYPDAEQTRAVADILSSDAQDYAAALAKMREAEELRMAQEQRKQQKLFSSQSTPVTPTDKDESKQRGLENLLNKWGDPHKKQ